jgi:two-component system alkaline phosphatase synthesis response regulator PhoP
VSARILLVEDEPGMVLTLTDRLRSEGYTVTHAADGVRGEQTALTANADLILLDVMLPRKGGFDVLRDLRSAGVRTPVLILTARGEVSEKVLGLRLGADDYLAKPFEMIELLARIESLLRRAQPAPAMPSVPGCTFGAIVVDFRTMEVTRLGTIVPLSSREFHLLRFLIEHEGTTVSRELILNAVWGYDTVPTTRTVDTHVTWLRQKLEEKPRYPRHILTVYGQGYKFVR